MEMILLKYFLKRFGVAALKKDTNGAVQGLLDMAGNTVPVPTIQKAQDGTVTFYDTQGLLIPSMAGSAGPAGPSAYDVAVSNGYVGTQAQWLASLQGPVGPAGAVPTNVATLLASKIGGEGGVYGISGTTNAGTFQLCDLTKFAVGTMIDLDMMLDYAASTSAKNISVGIGDTATAITTIASTTRNQAGDTGLHAKIRIARITATELWAPTKLDAGYAGATAQAIVTPPTMGSKLWLSVQMTGGEAFKLDNYTATLYPTV